MATRRSRARVKTKPVDQLEKVLTDLDAASRRLPDEEQKAYEDAQKSIVEAQRRAEVQEGHVRIL